MICFVVRDASFRFRRSNLWLQYEANYGFGWKKYQVRLHKEMLGRGPSSTLQESVHEIAEQVSAQAYQLGFETIQAVNPLLMQSNPQAMKVAFIHPKNLEARTQ